MLTFITGNVGKLKEAQAVIPELVGLDLALIEIQSLDSKAVIAAKLDEAAAKHEGEFIVEDTSLSFVAGNGLPGPLIKWFGKSIGFEHLPHIGEALGSNAAVAQVWIGYRHSSGETTFYEGRIDGQIVPPRGTNGFGWDDVFQPDGYDLAFAEMSDDIKNSLSMRRLAFEQLKANLA
ncbi:non-canonical purine NTP pyrophosphatase [Candidatus Saccharibacteria bacterium]|nr:non-canonical purine NTP pyrophosphatase [Candidatus Saccharibacteria bacterium]